VEDGGLEEVKVLGLKRFQDAGPPLRALIAKAKTDGEVLGIAMQIIACDGLDGWAQGYANEPTADANKVLGMAKVKLDDLLDQAKKEIAQAKAKEQPKVKAQKKSSPVKSFPKPVKKAKGKK
jgi:hypothetical protein